MLAPRAIQDCCKNDVHKSVALDAEAVRCAKCSRTAHHSQLAQASPKRCFLIDHPAITLVHLQANFLDFAEGRVLDVTVAPSKSEDTGTESPPAQIPDRQGGLVDIAVKSYELAGAKGDFPYVVPSSGEYTVCIAARGAAPATPWRVSFETQTGLVSIGLCQ